MCLQGCVKVWDISQPGNKSPVSQLDCLVSCHGYPEVIVHGMTNSASKQRKQRKYMIST